MVALYCGPGCANCCLVISVWGIIMLGVLGIFFKRHDIGLVEDSEDMQATAESCFIAAGLYVVTLFLSIYSKIMNHRAEASADNGGRRNRQGYSTLNDNDGDF